MNPGRLRCMLFLLLSVALPAAASCSRPILVPAAPSGQSITVSDGIVGGLIPEVLDQIGARAGCRFRYSVVPRIRMESMFEHGGGDLLVAATQVARRDRFGLFVPVVEARPTLISVTSERAPVRSIAALLDRRELRVALVRGYDYGPAYLQMIDTLKRQGRVYMEPDTRSVARLLAGNMADVTIMPASSFIGGLQGDTRTAGLAGKLRMEPLEELPWIKTGIYLSKRSLNAGDRAVLEQALTASVKSGIWWQALKRHYSAAVLADHTRPLEAPRPGSVSAP